MTIIINYDIIVTLKLHTPYGLVGKSVDFLTHGHAVREVQGSNAGPTIVGGVFHPTTQLAIFSPPNTPYIVNSKFV